MSQHSGYKRSLYLRITRKIYGIVDQTFNNGLGYVEYDGKNSFSWNGNVFLQITSNDMALMPVSYYLDRLSNFKQYVANDLQNNYGINVNIDSILDSNYEPIEFDSVLCDNTTTTTTTTQNIQYLIKFEEYSCVDEITTTTTTEPQPEAYKCADCDLSLESSNREEL